MAPTICSDKTKQQNLRVSHKELRRHSQMSRNLSLAHASPQASAVISYVSDGSLSEIGSSSFFRQNEVSRKRNSSSDDDLFERTEDEQPQHRHHIKASYSEESDQVSEYFVSSSNNEESDESENSNQRDSLAFRRSFSPLSDVCSVQYSDDFMLEDDEDDRLFPYDDTDSLDSDKIMANQMHSINVHQNEASDDKRSNTSSPKKTVLSLTENKSLAIKKSCDSENKDPEKYKNGLLSIALKTIKLVQRNKLLQQRLAQLQMETTEFIQSVLANPENQHFREKIQQPQQQNS